MRLEPDARLRAELDRLATDPRPEVARDGSSLLWTYKRLEQLIGPRAARPEQLGAPRAALSVMPASLLGGPVAVHDTFPVMAGVSLNALAPAIAAQRLWRRSPFTT